MIEASSSVDSLTWVYDLASQVREADAPFGSLQYGYDLAGNRTSAELKDGSFALTYEYDDDGRLWHIRKGSDTFTFAYRQDDQRSTLSFPNGAVTTYTPETLPRLKTIEATSTAGLLARTTYGYDDGVRRPRLRNDPDPR